MKSIKNFLFGENKKNPVANVEVEKIVEPIGLTEETKDLKINKETGIGELIEENPEMNDVLYEYGLYCGNCFAASFDTIEEGAKSHGLEDDEIEELIGELNKKMQNKKLEKVEIK